MNIPSDFAEYTRILSQIYIVFPILTRRNDIKRVHHRYSST